MITVCIQQDNISLKFLILIFKIHFSKYGKVLILQIIPTHIVSGINSFFSIFQRWDPYLQVCLWGFIMRKLKCFEIPCPLVCYELLILLGPRYCPMWLKFGSNPGKFSPNIWTPPQVIVMGNFNESVIAAANANQVTYM